MTLVWTWQRFNDLGADGVYDMLALRAKVFILEQGPFLDPDGYDRQSGHLLGRDAAGDLRAYLRLVDPGLKYTEPSIGRVVLDKPLRGSGLEKVRVEEQDIPSAQRHLTDQSVGMTIHDVHALQRSAPLIALATPEMRMGGRGSNVTRAGKNTNQAVVPFSVVTGIFERLPSTLQEKSMLRICDFSFSRIESEE